MLILPPSISATTGPQFSHLLHGNNNTFLTGLLWELNEITEVTVPSTVPGTQQVLSVCEVPPPLWRGDGGGRACLSPKLDHMHQMSIFRLRVRLLVAGGGGAKTQGHGIPGWPGVILSLRHVILAFLGPRNVYIHVAPILWTHPFHR